MTLEVSSTFLCPFCGSVTWFSCGLSSVRLMVGLGNGKMTELGRDPYGSVKVTFFPCSSALSCIHPALKTSDPNCCGVSKEPL